ncbi:MAG: fructosamine kinase family protein [Oleiphilaceae bacterium]|nr:fructosamine kinase family protein [Oleiphilaceae bacterium]
MLPLELQEWLFNEGYDWQDEQTVLGGDTCANIVCSHRSEPPVFIKYMASAPPSFFQCEAEGLSYLSSVSNVCTPDVYAYGQSYLVLEYIRPNQLSKDFWEQLGVQLAAIHSLTRDEYGFVNDNYCGRTVQSNKLTKDPFNFFAEQRLMVLAEKAFDLNFLAVGDLQAIEALCLRLDNIVPYQLASLLHGDLWSGNVHSNQLGLPVFIDPAVYYGWAETDIAMTRLFGAFDQRFYDAYQSVCPMEQGWEGRLDLYNLYPLLNHLVLFGQSYLPKVRDVLAKYA